MRISWDVAVASCALLLSGCAGVPVANTIGNTSVQGAALQGRVHGGQQAIVGASVYLYAANTTGYAGPGIAASSINASVSLLTSASNTTKDLSGNYYVTTDSNGDFTITGDYTCPSASSQVYIYSVGGNPGAGTNSAAGLLAGLGACSTLLSESSSFPFIFVDEVSTIATAYSIAGFATDATHVSSSNSTLALQGIANAFATVHNMETLSTGVALATTPAGNGQVPRSEINSLADFLAACLNSTGPSSTQCSTLLSNAMNGSIKPNDTATAAINIAHNPGANVSNLFTLQAGSPPFTPTMNRAPGDYTITINYSGGGLYDANSVAIDKSGNVWVVNNYNNSVSEFSPTGAAISGSSGYTGGGLNAPNGIAIDKSGNVWVGNDGNNSLSEFNSSGTAISTTSGYTGGGLNYPRSLAIDSSGNLWVANLEGNSVSEFSSGGTAISGSSGYTGGGLSGPIGIAVDLSGNAWVANDNSYDISEFGPTGAAISPSSGYTGGGVYLSRQIAVDASGNVWTPNYNNSLSEFSSSGSAISPSSGYTGGGLQGPVGVAIDGAGNVWAASTYDVSEFSSSGTAVSGTAAYGDGWYLTNVESIAIDGSGNVWLTNYMGPGSGYDFVSEVVGAATPVVTPMVANFLTPYGSHAVNIP